MLRRIYQNAKSSIWLYPLLYSLIAVFLSVFVTWIDKAPGQRLLFDLPAYFYTTSRLARDVLGIIASAFITISTLERFAVRWWDWYDSRGPRRRGSESV